MCIVIGRGGSGFFQGNKQKLEALDMLQRLVVCPVQAAAGLYGIERNPGHDQNND